MKKQWVKICPKCKSRDIGSNIFTYTIAKDSFNNEYKCKKCEYEGMFFPEVSK